MKRLILGVLGAMALFGCGGGGGGNGAGNARVAYINASPDSTNLAFDLNDDTKAASVPFGTATAFSSVKPGDYDVSIRPTSSAQILWSEAETLSAGQSYLALAIGLSNPDFTQDTEREKRVVISLDSVNRTAPTGSRARLVIVNAFVRKSGFASSSIDFRSTETPPVINSTGIDFGTANSIDVDSGAQTFEIRDTDSDQVFTQGTATLDPGSVYVALVSGIEGSVDPSAPAIRFIKLPNP
jgi:hypothetical protein